MATLSGSLIVRLVAAAGLAAALSGCAHSVAQPIDLAASAETFESRRLPVTPTGYQSYEQALSLALRNAAPVDQARAAYGSAIAAARTARVRPAMTLTLTAEYSRDSDPQRPWLYGGVLDVPIDRGGVRSGRIGTADLAILKARYDLIEAVWATRMALRRALADRDGARLELGVANRVVEARRLRLAAFERRIAAGEDARPLALLAATELASSTRRAAQARGDLAVAQAALAAAMGVTAEGMSSVEIGSPSDWEPRSADIASLRRTAAIGRGDVLRAVIDYDLAEQALRTAVSGQYPQVTIGPGYTWERGLTKLPFNLAIALPPLDLNRASINEAEVRRAEAGTGVEAAQATVFAQTDAAAATYAVAVAEIARLQTEDLSLAQRAVTLTARAVALGENDRTDALGAEAAVIDTELSVAEAQHRRALALADLEAATRHTADPAELNLLSDAVASLEILP